MTPEEKGYQLMAAALPAVGVAANRIKPPGDWSSLTLPYVVHFITGTNPVYTYDSDTPAGLRESGYQVSIFAADYTAAKPLVAAVISALSGNHGGVTFFYRDRTYVPEERAKDAGITPYHIALDFDVWAVD